MEPDFSLARELFLRGTSALNNGDLEAAEKHLSECLRLVPDRPSTKKNLALVYLMLAENSVDGGRFSEALRFYDRSVALDPNNPVAWSNKGILLNDQIKNAQEAIHCFLKAIEMEPHFANAYQNLAVAYSNVRQYAHALNSVDKAVSLDANLLEAWSNRGMVLDHLKRYAESLESYDKAIRLNPRVAEVWSNRSKTLLRLRLHQEALSSCERAIDIDPNLPEAWVNQAAVLSELKQYDKALDCCERAIKLKSNLPEAWSNRGVALGALKRYEEALSSFEICFELNPNADYMLGDLVHMQMTVCNWTDFDKRCELIEARLTAEEMAITPFPALGLFDDPFLLKKCASAYAKDKLGVHTVAGSAPPKKTLKKIRVAYFSMDFREHAVSFLMAELIECHDRREFEIYGFSFGLNTRDPMRMRLEESFDHFFDVRELQESQIAELSRAHEIDIAVDLGGYTHDSRPEIFVQRVAPIQINYLGFPGTMGLKSFDYLVADPVLIPADSRAAYSEKIIYMPDTYQVNDSKREISSKAFRRNELGLPEKGFVFVCFNNSWKILPTTFNLWMEILRVVPGSVLWLYESNPIAARNIRSEAEKRNVDPGRIVFASYLAQPEHLARYRLADLFLDTFPYGAHTTTSDALRAGVPVLTRTGRSFASRVGASLLRAVGLTDLITETEEDYVDLAIKIGSGKLPIGDLKQRLAMNLPKSPLFDAVQFARHLESAFKIAQARLLGGLPPDHIYVGRQKLNS